MSHELMVGLILNRDRIHYQRANTIAWGIAAAIGSDPLPQQWFEALTDTDLEAKMLMARSNANRELVRVLGKGGR